MRGYGGQQKGTISDNYGLWTVSLDLIHTEASFSPNSIDRLCLRVPWMPISRDMAIFVLMTRPIALPLACAHRVVIKPQISLCLYRVCDL